MKKVKVMSSKYINPFFEHVIEGGEALRTGQEYIISGAALDKENVIKLLRECLSLARSSDRNKVYALEKELYDALALWERK